MALLANRSKTTATLFVVLALVVVVISCWWLESYLSCEDQDEYSLRGACALKIKNRAQKGEPGPQWAYAGYLFTRGDSKHSETWYQKALQSSNRGIDLWGVMIGHCDKRPGLDHKTIESKLQNVAAHSTDANLLLLSLYLTRDCGAFSLKKATAVIPNLDQCAYLTIGDYLRISGQMQFPIDEKTTAAIYKNIALCHKEIATAPKQADRVKEIVPPREDSLEKLTDLLTSGK